MLHTSNRKLMCLFKIRRIPFACVTKLERVLQKLVSRINAPLSRQPLVKGERLVRGEVSAAMLISFF